MQNETDWQRCAMLRQHREIAQLRQSTSYYRNKLRRYIPVQGVPEPTFPHCLPHLLPHPLHHPIPLPHRCDQSGTCCLVPPSSIQGNGISISPHLRICAPLIFSNYINLKHSSLSCGQPLKPRHLGSHPINKHI